MSKSKTAFYRSLCVLLLSVLFSLTETARLAGQCQLHCPEDTQATCTQTSPEYTGYATLTPCSGFGMYYDVVEFTGGCSYLIQRHWSYSGLGTCVQLIHVTDTDYPVFADAPAPMTLDCNDPLPQQGVCVATDACDDALDYDFFAGGSGGTQSSCVVTTAVGPGPDWSLWLPGMIPGVAFWQFASGASFEEYADGTAHLSGSIYHPGNPDQTFLVDIWLEHGMNWTQWSALGRSYKDDLNLAGTLYASWTYYELANGFATLTGTGLLAGSQVHLTHFPVDYFYGFQSGLAANNKNAQDGLSGWFAYSGQVNGNAVSGVGDVNVNKDCTDTGGCASSEVRYIWRAEDDCGHVSFSTQLISVTDTTAPAIVAPESPIEVFCGQLPPPFVLSTDDCSEVSVEVSDVVVAAGCPGQVQRTYTVTDACGNAASVIQWINLVPEEGPYFVNFPADLVLECSPDMDIPSINLAFEGACSNAAVSVSEQVVNGECEGEYQVLRTYTLTDDCGNVLQQTWTIQVVDTTPPVLMNMPEGVVLACGASLPDAFVFAVDDCDSAPVISVSASTQQFDCGFAFVRTWFAVDACGNVTEQTEQVLVTDDTPPFFTSIPPDLAWPCNQPLPENLATAADECSLVQVTYSDVVQGTGCGAVVVRTFVATDGCGNVAVTDQVITLVDAEAPVFAFVPPDAAIACTDALPTAQPIVSDNCDAAPEVSEVLDYTFTDCGYIVERTFIATDHCGNVAEAIQTITATDVAPPLFSFVPGDLTVPCGAEIPVLEAQAEDACSDVQIAFTDVSLEAGCAGGFVRIFTATDACGNTSTAEVNVLFVDNEPPVFNALTGDLVLPCGAEVPAISAEATDNCSDVQISFVDEEDGSTGCVGGFSRIYTATDACGNASSAVVQVSFEDNEPPVFTAFPEDVLAGCEQFPQPEDVELAYTDNCSEVTLSYSVSEEAGYCPYAFTRNHIWTITDQCGNATTATWSVAVADHEPPMFSGVPGAVTLECGEAVPEAEVTVSDNCSVALVVTENIVIEDLPCGYNYIRIWTTVDDCGNEATATQVITFEDTTYPYFLSYPADITVECGQPVPAPEIPEAMDSCDGALPTEVTTEVYPGDCPGTYTTEYIYRAFDGCGNYVVWAQYITIIDTQVPVFDPVAPEVFLACTEFNDLSASASDNCGSPVVSHVDLVVSSGCDGLIERTYTATDACGNQSVAVQLIYIIDDQAPQLLLFPDDITVSCNDVPPADAALVQFTDNCSNVNVSLFESLVPGDCPNDYTLLRTWNLSDACGNTTVAVWTVSVYDDEGPVIYGVSDDMVLECGDGIPGDAVFAQDNCDGFTEVALNAFTVTDGCDELFIRTWMTMDACGNYTEATQTITFSDFTAPVLNILPQDEEVPCGLPLPDAPVLTATDNCDGAVEVILTEGLAGTDDTPYWQRTWCAVDCAGNQFCWNQQLYLCQAFPEPPAMPLQTGQPGDTMQQVSVYNSAGMLVLSMRTSSSKNQVIREIQQGVYVLSPGIYTLLTGSGSSVQTSRFVLLR